MCWIPSDLTGAFACPSSGYLLASQDDDDSYDSFEDDDDSYDSYDDAEDSSADDDGEDDDDQPVVVAGKGAGTPKKPVPASGNNDDRVKTATSAKKFGNARSAEERQADENRCVRGERRAASTRVGGFPQGCELF